MSGQSIWVEAFDAPFVIRQIERQGDQLIALMPYGFKLPIDPATLSVDEWDRFHALSPQGIAMVMSRPAQVAFFDVLDEFDDDSITFAGRNFPVEPWLKPFPDSHREEFWSHIYQTEVPRWELGRETSILPQILPQLKRPRSNVIVLGCGSGHDAAYLAEQGHVVTAVDFSSEAIKKAKELYGHRAQLTFVQSDVFNLPKEWQGKFDLVFEHTCYCAIAPNKRNELVKIWKRLLAPGGHLLGVFFVMDKLQGPPWGGSEWEVRARLAPHFKFNYWTRWRHSIEKRQNQELVVYAEKKEGSA